MCSRILVVDDERDFLDSIRRGLLTAGYKDICLKNDPQEAAALFDNGETFDLALIDVTMPRISGIELLEIIKNHSPRTECIMITAVNEASTAVECIKKGAYDYLIKPVSKDDLVLKLSHAKERKRLLDILELKGKETPPELTYPKAFEHIITRSPKMVRLLKEAELHAMSEVPILITGESGTGKELLAKAIHVASPRSRFPFMPVNMASLSANLFDAEFFGHTKGAFTGAEKDRAGYLESTNHGTIFLDEIGILPLDLQGKLLRVLQEGEFTKIGTSKLQKINIRFIAATNEDLEKLVSKGLFRKDLYYRLKGAWLHLPPLKERPEDIPLLSARFLGKFRNSKATTVIEEDALSALMRYDFPGNIRELKAILHSSANLAGTGAMACRYLPENLRTRKSAQRRTQPMSDNGSSLSDVEKSHILLVYNQTSRNKAETAKLLDIGINTLRRKLESYGEK
jgi:DNA-binding NtrC family response regulator